MSLRPRLFTRLMLLLCGIAAFSTGVAVVLQDRVLSRDLERAAAERLSASARSASRLVETHLAAMEARYEAIAGTPQLRANLEVDDPPTLAHYASELRDRSAALRILFVDAEGLVVAGVGDAGVDQQALGLDSTRSLVGYRGRPYAVVSVPLETGGIVLGTLVAVEALGPDTIAEWSELCGAQIRFGRGADQDDSGLQVVRSQGSVAMRVRSSFEAESSALANSRRNLLAAGLIALALAFVGSWFASRSVTWPILLIKEAAGRIGDGDFDARVPVSRGDEIGDVSVAVNEMAGRLARHAGELERSNEALRSLNAELAAARDRAEAGNRAKTAFLANVSHEIRTPMTAILGYTDLLLDGETTPADRQAWLETVRRNGSHLLQLVNDILDISRIESGKLQLERSRCDPAEIVRDALRVVEEEAARKGLAIALRYQGPVPRAIESDPVRIRQVLLNLLGNAIKFTPQGSVEVVVEHLTSSDPSALRFEVHDTGIGIPEEKLGIIFGAFSQADTSTTRQYGGSGLGLTISRRLARLLGGDLTVRSAPGAGSTFSFTIAAATAGGAAARPSGSAGSAGRTAPADLRGRILVAEDCPDTRRLVARLLRREALEVEFAEDGEVAVARASAAVDGGQLFDVILMDMQMPGMDGYEATRKLRRGGYEGAIVAFTAHAMRGDREKCIEAGCDDFLTKPAGRAELLATLARFLPS